MSELFQTEQYFRNRYRASGRTLRFQARTVDEWRVWQHDLRTEVEDLMGVRRSVSARLNPRITESVACEGYRRQRVEIDTEPGVVMPLFVLIPDSLEGSAPAILALHGHASGGKLGTAGVQLTPEVTAMTRLHNYDYGLEAVRRGYVVFCPDARGFGERRESLSAGSVLDSSCSQLSHMSLPLGMTVAGMWTWDLMVLLNYVATRPETQGSKIGAIGLSGGGAQSLWLAALDERVACAVVSGYFYGVEESLLHLFDRIATCDCNYVPHLWEKADMGDIGALIAPRPLLIEAGRADALNGPRGLDNVVEQCAIARGAYSLLGVEERFGTDFFDGGHIWQGTAAWPWLDRWLRA